MELPVMDGSRAASRAQALREFLHQESVAGVVLLAAAVAAMICANSPVSAAYPQFWHSELTLGFGNWAIAESRQDWVNGALMVVFFVVGLEIKRERTVGELREPRASALPVLAALGGVVLFGVRRLGWGMLPAGAPLAQAWSVAALGGIGFTIALFITDLAFDDERLIVLAKVGIFAGSLTAAVLGLTLLLLTSRRSTRL